MNQIKFMELLLKILIGSLFLLLLVLNFYFRRKVTRLYRVLIQNEVAFGSKHIFNKKRLEEEVIPFYPNHANEIRAFVQLLNRSIKIGFILVVIITTIGAVLLWDQLYNF